MNIGRDCGKPDFINAGSRGRNCRDHDVEATKDAKSAKGAGASGLPAREAVVREGSLDL